MKIAITGKGGVGKTTLAALLAGTFAAEGNSVLAVDANPDANLATALGFSAEEIQRTLPIAKMKDLIAERTGTKPGNFSTFFKLNPKVDDIPDRFSIKKDNIKLIVMGTVEKGGGGCLCPEGALLRSLVSHLLLGRSEIVIMDMDAGIEHLGRGTAKSVDAFIIVVEPGQRSFQTARAIKSLAQNLGIKKHYIVGCKTRSDAERQFITNSLAEFEVIGFVDYATEIAQADFEGKSVLEVSTKVAEEARKIKEKLVQFLETKNEKS